MAADARTAQTRFRNRNDIIDLVNTGWRTRTGKQELANKDTSDAIHPRLRVSLRRKCGWRQRQTAPYNKNGARRRRFNPDRQAPYELAFNTVTARRFCDQHEMSLHTATGRSLP
jgi:hypothetical protein